MDMKYKLTWMASLYLATHSVIIPNQIITKNGKRASFIHDNKVLTHLHTTVRTTLQF
jgi:hypothetical protein